MMQSRLIISLFVIIPTISWAGSLSATSVETEISSHGPQYVVRQLERASGRDWEVVLANIRTGSPVWLRVAKLIQAGTDAGTGEELTEALAYALLKNPEGVLSLVGSAVSLKHVCTVPLIEPSKYQFLDYKRKAISALKRVHNSRLADKAQACRTDFESVN